MAEGDKIDIEVGASIEKLNDGMNEASDVVKDKVSEMADTVKSMQESMEQSINQVKSAFRTFSELLAGGLIIKELTEFSDKTVQSGIALKHLSEQTGIAADKIRELGLAFQAEGASQEHVLSIARYTARSMNEAIINPASMAGQAYQALGMNTEYLKNHMNDLGGVIEDIGKKFSVWEDGPKRNAIAIHTMGRSALENIPALKHLSENLNLVHGSLDLTKGVTSETIDKLDEFDKQTFLLNTKLTQLKDTIVIGMIPAMTEFNRETRESRVQIDEMARAIMAVLNALIILKDGFVISAEAAGMFVGTTISFFVEMAEAWFAVVANIRNSAKRLWEDIKSGNFRDIPEAFEQGFKGSIEIIKNHWAMGVADMRYNWAQFDKDLEATRSKWARMTGVGTDEGLVTPKSGKNKGGAVPDLGGTQPGGSDSIDEGYYSMLKKKWDDMGLDLDKINRKYAEMESRVKDHKIAESIKEWTKNLHPFFQTFNQGVMSMLEGTRTISQGFRDMAKGMIMNMIQIGLQMIETGIMTMIADKIIAMAEAEGWIGVAGAKAGAFSAALGPAAAVGGAASAIAGIQGLVTPLLSGAGGYDVPQDMFMQVHKQEVVLPAHLAEGFKNIIASQDGSGGGPITINISAIDAKGVRNLFKREGSSLVKALKMQNRNFATI